jgi:hypothetical protein
MKKINLYGFIAAMLVLFSACDDYLDTETISDISSNGFYTSDSEIETAVLAIYDAMQEYDDDYDWEHWDFALTEMRSDNTKSSNSEGSFADFEDMDVDPTNVYVDYYWDIQYNVVMECNTVMNYIASVEDADLAEQFEGEARFGRALSHFNLVRLFGDIPIVDAIISPDEAYDVVRDDVDDVYTFIVSDLTTAISYLPSRDEVAEGRATVGAARTLLAKVYLTMGNYTDAKTQLEAVINSSDYALMDNYNDVFYSELNDEIIFAIQYISDDSDDSQAFSYEMTNLGSKSGLNFPTDDFIASVDVTDGRYSTLFTEMDTDEWECGKFISSSSSSEMAGNDWIVLRYADVLLMYVEAVMAGGSSTSDATAVSYYQAIRERAGFDVSSITSVTSDELLDERRVELAFENHRLFDLIRFDVADEVMSAFSVTEEADFNYDSDMLLLPIPQSELNMNDNMEQNPGY